MIAEHMHFQPVVQTGQINCIVTSEIFIYRGMRNTYF